MARIDMAPGDPERVLMDVWSGYDVERRRLMEFLEARQPSNPVVLTGDIHANWVNDLRVDYQDSERADGCHRAGGHVDRVRWRWKRYA